MSTNSTPATPAEYLEALPAWDGIPRLDNWLNTYLGVAPSEYAGIAGCCFLLGAVARALQPGCQFDYCLVLEGSPGFGKSRVAAILGGDWYGYTDLDIGSKDSMSALRDKWIAEIAELGKIARAETQDQKSFLTRQIDEYRPAYGQRVIRVPRQAVFIGTTNEWNMKLTGRRFWPVTCQTIALAALRADRDQLFAEALKRHRDGEPAEPTGEEQAKFFDPVQITEPEASEAWISMWVSRQTAPFALSDLIEALGVDVETPNPALVTRVGIALHKIGCARVERRTDENGRRLYVPPHLTPEAAEFQDSQPLQAPPPQSEAQAVTQAPVHAHPAPHEQSPEHRAEQPQGVLSPSAAPAPQQSAESPAL